MRKTTAILVLFATLIAASHANAYQEKVYKWKDADGVWHYSAKKPKSKDAESVTIDRVGKDVGKSTAAETTKTVPNSNCERARNNVSIYENNRAVKLDTNGDGVEESLDADQHMAELEKARKQVETFCAKS